MIQSVNFDTRYCYQDCANKLFILMMKSLFCYYPVSMLIIIKLVLFARNIFYDLNVRKCIVKYHVDKKVPTLYFA